MIKFVFLFVFTSIFLAACAKENQENAPSTSVNTELVTVIDTAAAEEQKKIEEKLSTFNLTYVKGFEEFSGKDELFHPCKDIKEAIRESKEKSENLLMKLGNEDRYREPALTFHRRVADSAESIKVIYNLIEPFCESEYKLAAGCLEKKDLLQIAINPNIRGYGAVQPVIIKNKQSDGLFLPAEEPNEVHIFDTKIGLSKDRKNLYNELRNYSIEEFRDLRVCLSEIDFQSDIGKNIQLLSKKIVDEIKTLCTKRADRKPAPGCEKIPKNWNNGNEEEE